jgi:DHA2 family multidrug resistance protein
MMFMLGFALLGSTLLLPLFMQTLLGYTAEQAGMGLSPGGFAIMLLMPLVGYLLGKTDARRLMIFGLIVLSFSLFHMTNFDLNVDFGTIVWARIIQAAGMAFLFVPINTTAYSFLPREKNNAASGLMNLARNIGGSVGISVVTTLLARRAQVHQAVLSENLSASNPRLRDMLHGITSAVGGSATGALGGSSKAWAMVQGTVIRQATMLAYIDCFWILGIAILVMIPLAFLMKKPKAGGSMAVH